MRGDPRGRRMNDLTAITWWVAILTILVGIQVIAVTIFAVRGLQLFKRIHRTLDTAERSIQPVVAETMSLISDIRGLRETAQRVERGVAGVYDRAERGVQHARSAVV